MAQIMPNSSLDFTVHRTPEAETPGYPFMATVTLDGHSINRITKSGLISMRREITRCLKEEVTHDDATTTRQSPQN